jgi:hypothetical protein
MTGEQAGNVRAPDAAAMEAAYAIYTPLMLSFYDRLVHGLSNRFAWRCPTERMLDLYRNNLSSRHLEAGVGTGFFIDRANPGGFEQLTLLDINRHCLARSARRLARYQPLLCEANLLAHRRRARTGRQYRAHLRAAGADASEADSDRSSAAGNEQGRRAVRGHDPRPQDRAEWRGTVSAAKGVFNNVDDDFEALSNCLKRRFDVVEIETKGCVTLFRAR